MSPNEKVSTNIVASISSSTSRVETDDFLPEDTSFATRAIHGGYTPSEESLWAIAPPIHLSTTFRQAQAGVPHHYEYGRSGNPCRDMLENNLAKLDNGKYGLCFSSGLGAVSVVLQMFKCGDHVICTDDAYGGTSRLMNRFAEKISISVTYYDFTNLQNLSNEIQENTRLVWIETPTNPLMKVIDIENVCEIVKLRNKDITIVVDNTFLTPYFQKPLSLGADIAVYSVTKYLNGHADVVMGAAVVNDKNLYEEMKFIQNADGIIPSPFDCYLVLRSLKTLKIRMQEHLASAMKVARFLESHPAVDQVLYPGLKSHPGYNITRKQTSGCSGMLSFYLKGGLRESQDFLKNLHYFQTAESLGGFESLAEIPSIMTHSSVSPDVREKLQITDNLIRLSVGLESVDDLITDLNQALNGV